jgi:hypothetical protein
VGEKGRKVRGEGKEKKVEKIFPAKKPYTKFFGGKNFPAMRVVSNSKNSQ